MSTSACIILTDANGDELCFYRHMDGYPEGTMPLLDKFIGWAREGRIRDTVDESAGWLVILGAQEMADCRARCDAKDYSNPPPGTIGAEPIADTYGWKPGFIEPVACLYDVPWLYVVDLKTKTIRIDQHNGYHYRGRFAEAATF